MTTKQKSLKHLEQTDGKCFCREMFPLKEKGRDERKGGKKRLVKGHCTADSRCCNSIRRNGSTDTGRCRDGVMDRIFADGWAGGYGSSSICHFLLYVNVRGFTDRGELWPRATSEISYSLWAGEQPGRFDLAFHFSILIFLFALGGLCLLLSDW